MRALALLLAALPCLAQVEFVRITPYLDGAKAAVTHTMDDSVEDALRALDLMDRHGIKATIFVSTRTGAIDRMWPRLRKAIADGHEIGSHSRSHSCEWPATEAFCRKAYSDSEVTGSRDDILKNTGLKQVQSWCYPCGLCADRAWVHEKLKAAGYLVARTYPNEETEGHIIPDEQGFASNPYAAAYTQVVQRAGGISKKGRTEPAEINAKFDEVYARGGIYHFMSHAQWLDLADRAYYDQHLKHVGGREDVWYVPIGPLYAYHARAEKARVSGSGTEFRVSEIAEGGLVTLEFRAGAEWKPKAAGASVRQAGDRVYVTVPTGSTISWSR